MEYNTIARRISLLENKVLARHKKNIINSYFLGQTLEKKNKKLVNTNG